MGKHIPDFTLDAMLDQIALATELTVCSTQPTNYTEAHTTYALADVTVTPGDGNGDFTIGNGDVDGRKLTTAQQADIDIDSTGDAEHIALSLVGSTELLAVTTCTSQTLTSGGTVTVPAWDVEISETPT